MEHTPDEFESIMRQIDDELGKQGVPVFKRPLVAATKYPCKNKLIGNFEPDPRMGSYEGPNLFVSIDKWYKKYYPVHSVLPDRLHTRIVLLRGEPFRLRIPYVFNAFGKLKVFDYLEDVSPALLDLIDERQRLILQRRFDVFCRETSNILLCIAVTKTAEKTLVPQLLKAGWADLKSCGGGFNRQDPGSTLFPAQQATEKYLKAYLLFRDDSVTEKDLKGKYGHKIEELLSACAAISAEFEQVLPDIDRLSFDQGVRYQRPNLTLHDIVDRIDLSHSICNLIASLLIKLQKSGYTC